MHFGPCSCQPLLSHLPLGCFHWGSWGSFLSPPRERTDFPFLFLTVFLYLQHLNHCPQHLQTYGYHGVKGWALLRFAQWLKCMDDWIVIWGQYVASTFSFMNWSWLNLHVRGSLVCLHCLRSNLKRRYIAWEKWLYGVRGKKSHITPQCGSKLKRVTKMQ